MVMTTATTPLLEEEEEVTNKSRPLFVTEQPSIPSSTRISSAATSTLSDILPVVPNIVVQQDHYSTSNNENLKLQVTTTSTTEVSTISPVEQETKTTTTTLATTTGENPSIPSSSNFSIDLVQRSQEHIEFLRYMYTNGYTVLASITTQSLYRYKNLWLPLLVEVYNRIENEARRDNDNDTSSSSSVSLLKTTEQLIPPPDVAWLWHCHRLAPARYRTYLQKEYGNNDTTTNTVNTNKDNISSTDTMSSILKFQDPKRPFDTSVSDITKQIWEELYPTEPFDLLLDKNILKNWKKYHLTKVPIKDKELLLCDGYDLLSASERQQSFYYQISLSHYQDRTYIKEYCIPMYYQFIQMKKHPSTATFFIVPTYPIDFMWHTHILTSIPAYGNDCRSIIGIVLNHDDNIGDRSDGSPLVDSWNKTCNLWYELYGTNYRIMGQYRGEPPQSYYKYSFAAMKKQQNKQRKIVLLQQRQERKQQTRKNVSPNSKLPTTSSKHQKENSTKQSKLFQWLSYPFPSHKNEVVQ